MASHNSTLCCMITQMCHLVAPRTMKTSRNGFEHFLSKSERDCKSQTPMEKACRSSERNKSSPCLDLDLQKTRRSRFALECVNIQRVTHGPQGKLEWRPLGIAGKRGLEQPPFHLTLEGKMGKNQTGLGPTRFRVILVMPPSEF